MATNFLPISLKRSYSIAPILNRPIDKILTTRFWGWFEPNKEQAGLRKYQGCLLQIISVYLLLELAKPMNEDLFIAFMDYQKCITAVIHMYLSTSYTSKVSNSVFSEPISTKHGVTQGKESSANLYTFYLSDMAHSL